MSRFQCDVEIDGRVVYDQILTQKEFERLHKLSGVKVLSTCKLKKGETKRKIIREDF